MPSQENYREYLYNLSFSNILKHRDNLISKIQNIEKQINIVEEFKKEASHNNYYHSYLKKLSICCKIIDLKYIEEFDIYPSKEPYINIIDKFLNQSNTSYDTGLPIAFVNRQAGKKFQLKDHIKGLVYAMLTNQTKWYRIEPKLQKIDKIFSDYNPDILKKESPYTLGGEDVLLDCYDIIPSDSRYSTGLM
jgi:predicted transcriptional regulator with HTH domain